MPLLLAAHSPPFAEGQTARYQAFCRRSVWEKTGNFTSERRLTPFRPPTQRFPSWSSSSALMTSSSSPSDLWSEVNDSPLKRYKPSLVPTQITPCESVSNLV